MTKIIQLKDRQHLAQGNSRLVFRHPENSDYLIKVMRPDKIDERFGSGAKWYKRLRRLGKYLSYHREIEEFLAVHTATDQAPPFLQTIIGFTETDLGLGLIILGAFQENGDLAPSLGHLLKKHRYDKKMEAALEACFSEILASPVIISDLNVGNFVYLEEHQHFIMIDGLGNANPLGFKAFSKRLNRRAKLRRFARFRERIERYKKHYQHPT